MYINIYFRNLDSLYLYIYIYINEFQIFTIKYNKTIISFYSDMISLIIISKCIE